MHMAALRGHAAVVEFLHSRGASTTAQRKDKGAFQPVHLGAARGHAPVVELLVGRLGVKLDQKVFALVSRVQQQQQQQQRGGDDGVAMSRLLSWMTRYEQQASRK